MVERGDIEYGKEKIHGDTVYDDPDKIEAKANPFIKTIPNKKTPRSPPRTRAFAGQTGPSRTWASQPSWTSSAQLRPFCTRTHIGMTSVEDGWIRRKSAKPVWKR